MLVSIWPRGVTVSTLDSESSDRGSNPREASLNQLQFLLIFKQKVMSRFGLPVTTKANTHVL